MKCERAGWDLAIPSETPHTVTDGDAGAVVVDVFTPVRGDWAARFNSLSLGKRAGRNSIHRGA